jgi:hypothetical protein
MKPKERFVILAQSFLDSFNPKLDYAVVVLDCILAVPPEKIETIPGCHQTLRHFAHAFVRGCEGLKQKGGNPGRKVAVTTAMPKIIADWLNEWWEEFGV